VFYRLWNRPAQLGSRRGKYVRKDKQFRAAISFVESRKRFGDNWAVFFKFVCLKVMFQKQFLHCFKIYKEGVCFSESTLLFKFETKFRSRAKGSYRRTGVHPSHPHGTFFSSILILCPSTILLI
jgi:hypothetical protein